MLDDYADTVPGGEDYDLALWHGFGLPLLLSVLVLAVGAAAYFGRDRLRRLRTVREPLGNADRIYDAAIRGLDLLSVRLTAATQRGSIPATQSVILSTLVLVPLIVLALGARDRPDFALWDSPLQVVVGLMILAAALGATVMRNRLAAVLLVGVTGYGCGAIFAFHGAPDLALTQFLVETLTAGDLRAGAADAARRGRPRPHQAPPIAARRAGTGGRRDGHHAGGVRDGRAHRTFRSPH